MRTSTSDVLPQLDAAAVTQLVDLHFPQMHAGGKLITIEAIEPSLARLRMRASDRLLRPGGTISGPALFGLADFAFYAALLGMLGESALGAVTSNLNITFLARPEPVDVLAETRLVRIGRRTAYGVIELRSDGSSTLVAHATGSYALPRRTTTPTGMR